MGDAAERWQEVGVGDERVNAVVEALGPIAAPLRSLGHAYVHLDANAMHLIARQLVGSGLIVAAERITGATTPEPGHDRSRCDIPHCISCTVNDQTPLIGATSPPEQPVDERCGHIFFNGRPCRFARRSHPVAWVGEQPHPFVPAPSVTDETDGGS